MHRQKILAGKGKTRKDFLFTEKIGQEAKVAFLIIKEMGAAKTSYDLMQRSILALYRAGSMELLNEFCHHELEVELLFMGLNTYS
jgi:hypothetical protein